MIILTAYNTDKKIYVDEKEIARVTDGHDLVGSRSYPWTEVAVYEDGKEKILRVLESSRLIGKLISESIRKKTESKNNAGK